MFKCAPRFDLPDSTERCRLFLAFRLAALLSLRSENARDALFFIEYSPSHVGANLGLVVRMSDNHQKIGFETFIWFWIGTILRQQKRGQAGHKAQQMK